MIDDAELEAREMEEKIDYSAVPIMVEIKGEQFELTVPEAINLIGQISSTLHVWMGVNGGR